MSYLAFSVGGDSIAKVYPSESRLREPVATASEEDGSVVVPSGENRPGYSL